QLARLAGKPCERDHPRLLVRARVAVRSSGPLLISPKVHRFLPRGCKQADWGGGPDSVTRHRGVDTPFGRIPIVDGLGVRPELLLDAGPARGPARLRVRNSCVLIDLTKRGLAVDQLRSAAPEGLEVEAEPCKLRLLPVGHDPDHVGVAQAARVGEALPDPVDRPGPRDNELPLREVRDGAIINVSDVL